MILIHKLSIFCMSLFGINSNCIRTVQKLKSHKHYFPYQLNYHYQIQEMLFWMNEEPCFGYSQYPYLQQSINQIKIRLQDLIRQKIPTSAKNQRFTTRYLQNQAFQLTIEMISWYKTIFKTFLKITIIFEPNLNTKVSVQYTIESSLPSFIQKVQCLSQTIAYLESLSQLHNRNFIFRRQTGLRMYEKAYFMRLSIYDTFSYAMKIFEKIMFPFEVCDMIYAQLQKINSTKHSQSKQQLGLNPQEQKKYIKSIKAPQMINLIEQEQEGFREYFAREGIKSGLLRTVAEAEYNLRKKKSLVTKSIQILRRQKPGQKSENKEKFKGSFSKVQLIKCAYKYSGTIIQCRKNAEQQYKLYIEEQIQNGSLQIMDLIQKQIPQKTQHQKAALESFRNEFLYLVDIGGNSKSLFINNYYIQSHQGRPKNDADLKQKNIYSDYHQLSVWDKFYDTDNTKYTMSDITNLAEQVISGLIEFYLWNGFIHRDVKDQNLLIDFKSGIVKFIDHGSVFPFDLPQNCTVAGQKFDPKYIENMRKDYHSILRSTLYVNKKTFDQRRDALSGYPDFNTYKMHANTHPTFDVYSVGIMLKKILYNYFGQDRPQWMEVKHRWKVFTDKMTKLNPSERIPMDEALEEVKKIRKFIFEAPQKPTIVIQD